MKISELEKTLEDKEAANLEIIVSLTEQMKNLTEKELPALPKDALKLTEENEKF